MIDLAGELSKDTPYDALRAEINDRLARFEAGIMDVPRSFQRRLKALDKDLSARWDMSRECWVIERYVPRVRAYMDLFTARHLDERVFAILHESDTHRYRSVDEFMRVKREEAAKKRAEIDRQNTENLMGVADSMSPTQITNFYETQEYLSGKGAVCI
jgi:hypothetical protein